MTREELDFIGSMNMCDEISNEAYKKIVCHCGEQEPCEDAISRQAVLDIVNNPLNIRLDEIIKKLPPVNPQIIDQWQELKETIIEMRDNDGIGTQQEACKFLANLMDVLGKQMQEPKTGHWINNQNGTYTCDKCGGKHSRSNYCPNCGCRMVEPQESEG